MTDNGKTVRFAGWIAAATVALFVAYPLSLGPACWATSRLDLNGQFVTSGYQPIIWAWRRSPRPILRAIESYTYLYSDPNWAWAEPPLLDGDGRVVFDSDGSPER